MSKTALVTGASRGIGFEIAKALAEKGHRVIALSRTEALLQELKEQYPDHIHLSVTDLTDEKSLRRLESYVGEHFSGSGIDILVNNAGALVNKSFEKLTKSDWQHMLDVNLLAPVDLVGLLLPHFTGDAHIVNISSMGGYQGSSKFPGLTAYSTAKGALSILGECLAAEFSDSGIRVNTLCIGAVQTEMLEEAFPGFEAPVDARAMGQYIANFALEGAAFYNGQILPVTLGDPG